jgi:hypothetical protein
MCANLPAHDECGTDVYIEICCAKTLTFDLPFSIKAVYLRFQSFLLHVRKKIDIFVHRTNFSEAQSAI